MPNYTSNYKFIKPTSSELYDINVFNENADAIDKLLVKMITNSDIISVANGGTGASSTSGAVLNLLVKTLVNDSNIVDANTLTGIGIYRNYFESTIAADYNYPAQYGVMFVFASSGYIAQVFADVSAHRLYYRTSVNSGSTWTDWKRVVTLTELENALTEKADVEHSHSADDVTSGTLPIARGGTGASSVNSAVTNLFVRGSYTASNAVDANSITGVGIYRYYLTDVDYATFNLPAQYITMFVFGVSSYVVQIAVDIGSQRMYFRSTSNSGSTWSTWKREITLGDVSDTVSSTSDYPVSGAAVATYAAKKSTSETVTVTAASWTGDEAPYTATVASTIATATNNLIVGAGGAVTAEQQEALAAAMIICTRQAEGGITLTAFGDKPEIDLPVNIICVG